MFSYLQAAADRCLHVKGASVYQTFTRTDAETFVQGVRLSSLAGSDGCATTALRARDWNEPCG